jgi:acetylornithine deacetylase/succinyl-diaminopimelate desuccinylase-like protein
MSGICLEGLPAPYAVTGDDRARLTAVISQAELVSLALELSNIPSRSGHEKAAADHVLGWLQNEGFAAWAVGATPERPNVIGCYGGKGQGRNLLFTAHLDTQSPTRDPDLDAYKYKPKTLTMRDWEENWLEDGVLRGFPLTNDRGPMACSMIAAKALKTAGFQLKGKLYITACPGEIGPEPIEEYRGVGYLGKDIGANYLFHHGGVAPDYVIAAEGTDFGVTWVGSGYAVFRFTLLGETMFTPAITTPAKVADHPNPISRMGPLLEALNAWAVELEASGGFECAGGLALPKAQIAAVRGGIPFDFGAGTEVCRLYFEVGLTPAMSVADVQRSLERLAVAAGYPDVEVEPLIVRRGYAADDKAVSPLVDALNAATQLTRGAPITLAKPIYSSMWRDHNVFNMQQVPAVTTGFTRRDPTPQDLVDSALIYALTALAVCGKVENEPA